MRSQFRNPPRISLVGFFAWTGPHLAGIAHEHLNHTHKDMVDRLQYTPVLSIATTGQCWATSQSLRANSAA